MRVLPLKKKLRVLLCLVPSILACLGAVLVTNEIAWVGLLFLAFVLFVAGLATTIVTAPSSRSRDID
jgi:hypothetical protein